MKTLTPEVKAILTAWGFPDDDNLQFRSVSIQKAELALTAVKDLPVHERMHAMGMFERCHMEVGEKDCPLWTENRDDPLGGS